MPEYRRQYLESLDSVRSPWQGNEQHDTHELQVLLEVVLALALGRSVVVPQAFAFDSFGFLKAASDVLGARDSAGVKDRPFRLHLHGAETFDGAVDQMLARIGDERRPFVSSLIPEFQQPEQYGIDRETIRGRRLTVDRLLSSGWIDDERAGLLDCVRREFSSRPAVTADPQAGWKPLNVVLTILVGDSSPMTDFVAGCPESVQQVWSDILGGFAALDPGRSGAFDQRSRIHEDTAWIGDPRRRSAEEILGSRELLELLREFLDTVYNQVVAASIGRTTNAVFTTGLVGGNRSLTNRAIAQDLALAGCRLIAGEFVRPIAAEGSVGFGFELVTTMDADDPLVTTEVDGARQLRQDLLLGLPALFEQRAVSSTGRPDSPFWQSVDLFEQAPAAGAAAAREALNEHLDLVCRILGSGGKAGNLSEFRLMAIEASVGLPLWGATVHWQSSAPWLGGIGPILTIAAPAAVRRTKAGVERHRKIRRISRAFGRAVEM